MLHTRTISVYLPAFLIPTAIVLVCVLIALSSAMLQDPGGWLARGITVDLVVTAPLVYFLLIRKRSISKLTVVPWIVGGILLAKAFLPAHNNEPALWASQYLLPIIELVVLSVVGYRIYLISASFKRQGKQLDFLTAIQHSTAEVFGKGLAATLLAWEIAVFYYAFFKWRKPLLGAGQFTYHRKSTVKPVLVLLLFLVVVETFVLHLLISIWSPVAAWIVTGLSIYSFFWIMAQIKAMGYRPLAVEDGTLQLRHGMVFQCDIPLDNISVVCTEKIKDQPGKVLSLLPNMEGPNLQIELKEPIEVTGLYGWSTEEQALKLRVDEPEKLQELLEGRIA